MSHPTAHRECALKNCVNASGFEMRIRCPKETAIGESRVALTTESAIARRQPDPRFPSDGGLDIYGSAPLIQGMKK